MDRMRAGLTGLGIVFLFTLAAAVAFAPSEGEVAQAVEDKVPGEPLAQLGVAPGPEKDRDEPEPQTPAKATPEGGQAPATESPASSLPRLDAGPAPGGDGPVRI